MVNFKKEITPLLLSCIILIFFEIISTTIFPIIGIDNVRIPFHVLIILYMGFKLETAWLGILIFVVMFTHSFFTIEGWEMGAIAGIITCTSISYLRDVIHLSSVSLTMITVQIFQMVWFFIVALLIYIQIDGWGYIVQKFWRFIPESILISILAPFAFNLLDKIWNPRLEGSFGSTEHF